MDHALIDENQIPDRYLMGRLTPEERQGFEEHIVDCPACTARLETLESLRAALKELAPEERFVGRAPEAPAPLAWRRPLRAGPLAALLAAACLAIATLPSAFFLRELRRTRLDLDAARRASEESQRREADLRRTLETARAEVEQGRAVMISGAKPTVGAVFALNLVLGGGAGPPENRITLTGPPQWVVLVVDRPDVPGFSRYRVRLSTAAGQPVGPALTPSPLSGDQLAVGLHSTLLPDGDYVLTLEGVTGTGQAEALATYGFRLARKN